MLTLPPISISCGELRFEFVLPCPATDLIRLATLLGRAERPAVPPALRCRRTSLQQLINANPALLLFCAATYQHRIGGQFMSLDQLTRWCETNLLDVFDTAALAWSQRIGDPQAPDDVSELSDELQQVSLFHYQGQPIPQRCLKQFLQSQHETELNHSLAHFLVVATECCEVIAGNCVQQLFDSFSSCRARATYFKRKHRDQRRAIYAAWRRPDLRPLDVETLFGLHRQISDADSEFTARLRREKMAAMKQLAYGASHEINNPLANIATRAQSLLSGESNPERRHKLSVIYEQALRAHEMISDLMLFADPPELVLINIDLRAWLAKLMQELEPALMRPAEGNAVVAASWESARIELQIRLGPGLDQFSGDPQHLGVALKLLIRNSIESIRATPGSGEIGLRVYRRVDGWICFSVIDDGAGIPPAIREHLFDPFYSGREAGRGLGFGLPKAWRIAELHAGELEFDPHYMPGTRFELRVPPIALA